MCEASVEFDYMAQEDGELTIKKGDIIKDVTKKYHGWCEGVLNDKKGVFPENYVKLIGKDVTYRNKKDSNRQCRVVFSYQPLHPDELNLNIGDIIDIIGEDEEGWWKGFHNGKEGVFPSNFVEEIFPFKPKMKSSSGEDLSTIINDTDTRIPNLPPKPSKVLCEVKYAYKAQNDDELTLKEGDIITLTNREVPDPGWWEGELNGRVGVFPDNFVAIIKQNDERSSKDDTKLSKLTPELMPLKAAATISQRTSLEHKNEGENKLNPPLLHKKPVIPKKKSPSSATKGFLAGIVNRKSDSVDGIASSKSQQLKNDVKVDIERENNGENSFDQVERTPLLKDVRAGRAKPPIRRPPSVVKDKPVATESEDAVSSEEETPDSKPAMREWEKHKAPWLEEMKMSQAKRSSTSPISEKNLSTKGLYPELDKSPVDNNVMSKSMPCPATSKTSPIEPTDKTSSSSILKSKPNNLQNLTRNTYSNVDIPLSVHNAVTVSPNSVNAKTTTSTNLNKYNKNMSGNEKHNTETEKPENNLVSDDFAQETVTLTVQNYSELLERIQRLEVLVQRQTTAIEDLRAMLFIECDKRKLLKVQKITQ